MKLYFDIYIKHLEGQDQTEIILTRSNESLFFRLCVFSAELQDVIVRVGKLH